MNTKEMDQAFQHLMYSAPNCPICGEQLIDNCGQLECRNMCEDHETTEEKRD